MSAPEPWGHSLATPMRDRPTWPHAAWGDGRGERLAVRVGEAPSTPRFGRLGDRDLAWTDLSDRALSGFVKRARVGRLQYPAGFLERLEARLT